MDVEAQNSAEAITIYMAVTGKGEAAYSREKDRSKWERAAIAASDMRRKHPHSAVKTLSKIGEVAACFGRDWPDVPGEPEILRRVKWAARQLQAARALPAGMEPVGEIQASSELGVAPYASIWPWLQPGTKLYTAAQVQAMGRVPPGWQAVPVDLPDVMVDAFENAMEAATTHVRNFRAAWHALLAAAPRPPVAQGPTLSNSAELARKPLTDKQVEKAHKALGLEKFVETFRAGVEFAQKYHGITHPTGD